MWATADGSNFLTAIKAKEQGIPVYCPPCNTSRNAERTPSKRKRGPTSPSQNKRPNLCTDQVDNEAGDKEHRNAVGTPQSHSTRRTGNGSGDGTDDRRDDDSDYRRGDESVHFPIGCF